MRFGGKQDAKNFLKVFSATSKPETVGPLSTTTPPPSQTPFLLITPTITPTLTPIAKGKFAFVSFEEGRSAIYIANTESLEITKLTSDMTVILNPCWSPNGQQIAFSACLEGEGECTGNFDIFVISHDGSQILNLTNNPADDMYPDWSPDGQQIIFNSYRSGDFEIYVMNADGTNVKQIISNSTAATNPRWSPSGAQIAYVATDNGGWYYEIWVTDPAGKAQIRLTKGVTPLWSPDGSRIAFHGGVDSHLEIFSIKPDGTGLMNLTNSPADEFGFSWSPDSKSIAFVSNRGGNTEIYILCAVCAGDYQLKNITNSPASDQHPTWSPDGTSIAYISDDRPCVINIDGSQNICFDIKATGAMVWQP